MQRLWRDFHDALNVFENAWNVWSQWTGVPTDTTEYLGKKTIKGTHFDFSKSYTFYTVDDML